jgi:hypothetical protein
MYSDGQEYPLDSTREVTVFLYTKESPHKVLTRTGDETPVDLTRFATKITQTANELAISLAWHDELFGNQQPKPGQLIEILLDLDSFWIGPIQTVRDYRLEHGRKSLALTARTRDATPVFRDTRRTTQVYPTATPIHYIATQVAQSCGLQTEEIDLTDAGSSTVHSNVQMADMTPWQMLSTLYEPAGLEPYVDVRGRLKCISRDITRESDVTITDLRRLVRVSGSKNQPLPLSELRVRWLDPNLTEVSQVAKVLDTKTITAGFFQVKQAADIWFSADRTQRAKNTQLVIKQSANSGLLKVCSEEYEQLSTTQGKITLKTHYWVPTLATAALVTKALAHKTPDGVASVGAGVTIPKGRLLEFAADAVLFLTMMSIGTGVYEIWGTPYDFVHTRNTTTAFNANASVWEIRPEELENDFVMNEDQAYSLAVRELLYRYRSSVPYDATIIDDTRIERGDIIELPDGSRLYVLDYSRDLSYGAPAVLDVNGFLVGGGTAGAGGAYTTNGPTDIGSIPVGDVDTAPESDLPDGWWLDLVTPPDIPDPVEPDGGAEDPIIVYNVPAPLADTWTLRIPLTSRKGYIGFQNIGITQWTPSDGAVVCVKTPPPGSTADDYYFYWQGSGIAKQKYSDQAFPNGSCRSSGSARFSHPAFAFGQVGAWWPGNGGDDGGITGAGDPWIAYVGNEQTFNTTFTIDPPGGYIRPRYFDIEADGKIAASFREANGIPQPYRIRQGGIYFWRIRVSRTKGEYDVPDAPFYLVRIAGITMHQGAGENLCTPDSGRGDANDYYFEQANSGSAAFTGGYFEGYRDVSQLECWVRFEFNDPTIIDNYSITAADSASAPAEWTLEASVNGVDWTVVDYREGIFFDDDETKAFELEREVQYSNATGP